MFYAHAECDYKGRARFDDLLHVHARIGHVGNTSFTFEFAAYRDDNDGEWKSSGSFSRNEIPLAIYCLQKAFEHMIEKQQEENSTPVEEVN